MYEHIRVPPWGTHMSLSTAYQVLLNTRKTLINKYLGVGAL